MRACVIGLLIIIANLALVFPVASQGPCTLPVSGATMRGHRVFENCTITGTSWNIALDPTSSLTLTFRNVRVTSSGIAFITSQNTMANVVLIVEDSSFVNCGDILVFSVDGTARNITVTVNDSVIESPKRSALTFFGTHSTVQNVAMMVINSRIHCGGASATAADRVFALGFFCGKTSATYTRVTLAAVNSDIAALSSSDNAGALAICREATSTLSPTDLLISVNNSTVAVTGLYTVGAAAVISSAANGGIDAVNTRIAVTTSRIHVSGIGRVASVGFMSSTDTAATKLQLQNAFLGVSNSSVSLRCTTFCSAAGAMSITSSGPVGQLFLTSVTVEVVHSAVTALLSQGVGVVGGFFTRGSNLDASLQNVSIRIHNSTCLIESAFAFSTSGGLYLMARVNTQAANVGSSTLSVAITGGSNVTAVSTASALAGGVVVQGGSLASFISNDVFNLTVTNSDVRSSSVGALCFATSLAVVASSATAALQNNLNHFSLHLCDARIYSDDAAVGVVMATNTGFTRVSSLSSLAVRSWLLTALDSTVSVRKVSSNIVSGTCFGGVGQVSRVENLYNSTTVLRRCTVQCDRETGYPMAITVKTNSVYVTDVVNASGASVALESFRGAVEDPQLGPFTGGDDGSSCAAPVHRYRTTATSTPSQSRSAKVDSVTLSTSPAASRSMTFISSDAETPPLRSRSMTLLHHHGFHTSTLTHHRPIATAAPVVTPQPPANSSRGSVHLTVLLPAQAADAITTSATATSVVTAVVNPTTAAQAARIGAMVEVLSCALPEVDDSPSFAEMPLQAPIGDGPLRIYAGALLLTTTVLVALPAVLHLGMRSCRSLQASKGLAILGAVHAVSLQYFVPVSLSVVALLVSAGDATEVAIAAASAVIVTLAVVPSFVAVSGVLKHNSPASASSSSLATSSSSSSEPITIPHRSQLTIGQPFFAFVDAARNPENFAHRMLFFEELFVSVLISVVTNVKWGGSCDMAAAAVCVVALAHGVYLVVFRPYRSRIDTLFSGLCAVLQLHLGVLVLAAAITSESRGTIDALIAGTMLALFALFFVQSIASFAWYFFRKQAQLARAGLELTKEGSLLEMPLLVATSSIDASTSSAAVSAEAVDREASPTTANPLLKSP